jgi:hypothetical protein
VLDGKEGLSQGDPLAMILYSVALMPLVEHVRRFEPDALTPWYANDAAAVGQAESCAKSLWFLSVYGPIYGYYAEPEKSYYIRKEEDEAMAKCAFYSYGLKVIFLRGKRYLGGFVGAKDDKLRWVEEKVKVWVDGVLKS